MHPVVEVAGLKKTFSLRTRASGAWGTVRQLVRPRYREVEAVRSLDFRMAAGESLALIGPNGAGKSTTLKMLTGILYPSGGTARVLGLTPWSQRAELSMNIATVFGQRSQLWMHLPAQETFELLARIYELPRAEYRARRAALVERFELGPLMESPVRKLSLGERMRCEVAASLLHRPQVVFLDEPTIGLDVVAKQQIRALVRELNERDGVSVLLTSHDAGDIEHLCKRVIVVNHGTVVFDDRVSTLRRRYLRRKVIDVKVTEQPSALPELPGVQVVKRSAFGLKLEVDTDAQPIGAVVGALVATLSIADITIEDPPMEEIIAAMYRDQTRSAEPREVRA